MNTKILAYAFSLMYSYDASTFFCTQRLNMDLFIPNLLILRWLKHAQMMSMLLLMKISNLPKQTKMTWLRLKQMYVSNSLMRMGLEFFLFFLDYRIGWEMERARRKSNLWPNRRKSEFVPIRTRHYSHFFSLCLDLTCLLRLSTSILLGILHECILTIIYYVLVWWFVSILWIVQIGRVLSFRTLVVHMIWELPWTTLFGCVLWTWIFVNLHLHHSPVPLLKSLISNFVPYKLKVEPGTLKIILTPSTLIL